MQYVLGGNEENMKIKKRMLSIVAGVLAAVMLTNTASAHSYDYLGGKYIGLNGAKRVVIITPSAYTELLNPFDVYLHGESWNNISSNVKIMVLVESKGMPAYDNATRVVGSWDLGGATGETKFYDKNGNPVGINSDCAYSEITMNTHPDTYSVVGKKITSARKTFIHEIGHVLKLDHPKQSSLLEGHDIDGRPYAVMNQGLYYVYPDVSTTVTEHDKACLKAKWGA